MEDKDELPIQCVDVSIVIPGQDPLQWHSIVHHWHRADRAPCKTDKLCWYYNGHSLPQNNLRNKLNKSRARYLLMQFVEVSYV